MPFAMRFLPRPKPASELAESVWQWALRETERTTDRRGVKRLGLAVDVVVIVASAGALIHANKATVWIVVLSVVAGLGSRLILPVAIFVGRLPAAPFRQRNDARAQVHRQHHESLVREHALRDEIKELVERGENEFQTVAMLFGTELRDIRTKIEKVTAVEQPAVYPPGFALPAYQWAKYDKTIAGKPDAYKVVERAYTTAHQFNEGLRARELRTRAGMSVPPIVTPEDGLDDIHRAVGEALDALGQLHNEPYRSAAQRAAAVLLEDAVARARG